MPPVVDLRSLRGPPAPSHAAWMWRQHSRRWAVGRRGAPPARAARQPGRKGGLRAKREPSGPPRERKARTDTGAAESTARPTPPPVKHRLPDVNGRGGDRTRTEIALHGILSPVRLPVSPLGRVRPGPGNARATTAIVSPPESPLQIHGRPDSRRIRVSPDVLTSQRPPRTDS